MRSVVINVASPAGPPPFGAPVETSIPFAQGKLRTANALAVFAPDGKSVLAQLQPAMYWPDGSIRWLYGIFEAEAGPGEYILQAGKAKQGQPLLSEQGKEIILDTGELHLTLSRAGKKLFEQMGTTDAKGDFQPLVTAPDLVLQDKDGKIFRASLAGKTRKLIIEESGPMRASLRIEGKCQAQDGAGLFDFIIRLQAYRGRPELLLSVTWINTTNNAGELLRDIRLVFPYQFEPNRLVIGCQTGVYDGPFSSQWPTYVLQEDHNWYWAKTHQEGKGWLNLSSGGCNGERCPGWLYLTKKAQHTALGVYMPNFWQEAPNELEVAEGKLRVGLWPERAAKHLSGKQILPSNPEGVPYTKLKYTPIMPHPYLAFFNAEHQCLEVPRGMAKTQQVLLSVGPGKNKKTFSFEKKYWHHALLAVRGFVDPRQVAESRACGLFWPRDTRHFPEVERTFDEAFDWYNRHVEVFNCYGKFDYGDFRYMVPSTDYICHEDDGKWGKLGEMPREGYWANNEGDCLRELLFYYLRTGNRRAWELGQAAARHLMEVDFCHQAPWGSHTHSYGHCFVATSIAGAPDHAWLLGAMEWAGLSGDPVLWDWLMQYAEALVAMPVDFVQNDTRSTGMHLHILCQFYHYTGDKKYLEAAKPSAQALCEAQLENGSWPAYLGNHPDSVIGFVDHAVAALADYYAATGEADLLPRIKKAIQFEGEVVPLYMYALALAGEKTSDPLFIKLAKKGFRQYDEGQNRSCDPIGRGDSWAGWGVNRPEYSKETDRPPQFLGQTRTVAPLIAYVLGGLWLLAREGKLPYPRRKRSE